MNAIITEEPKAQDGLKPCPFCGGKAFKWSWNGGVCIECENYHVDKHRIAFLGKTEAEVVKAWNTRLTVSQ